MPVIKTNSVEETRHLGERLGRLLGPGDVLCVYGPLGAGKTALAQGVARGLGVTGPVTSPTFILIQEHEGRLAFYHFDAYRLEGIDDFSLLGYEEYFDGAGVSFVEWADRVAAFLPEERLDIYVEREGDDERSLNLEPRGPRYRALVEELTGL